MATGTVAKVIGTVAKVIATVAMVTTIIDTVAMVTGTPPGGGLGAEHTFFPYCCS